eukprot:s175_g11.t1
MARLGVGKPASKGKASVPKAEVEQRRETLVTTEKAHGVGRRVHLHASGQRALAKLGGRERDARLRPASQQLWCGSRYRDEGGLGQCRWFQRWRIVVFRANDCSALAWLGPRRSWLAIHQLIGFLASLAAVDLLQSPGDTVFAVTTTDQQDVTIACTRNIFPAETLEFVLPRMRSADPAFAKTFLELLRQKRPEAFRCIPEGDPAHHAAASKPAVVGPCPSWQLHRRHCESLSLAECRREFIRPGRPLIIEGLGPHLVSQESCNLSRDWLSTHFGEKMVAVYRNFCDPGMRDGEDQVDLMRLSEALAELQGPRRKGLYLYDLSLPLKLPGLLEHVKLPRFFSHCYLQQTMRKHCFSRSWPTLFIGAEGSQARLHVDQWHGNFWMYLVSGAGLRRLNCTKYHYLKFVEKQKVERRLKSCKRQLVQAQEAGKEELVGELQKQLRSHLADHEYITYYPKHLPYNSLFPAQDSEASQQRRAEIRRMIREQLAQEGTEAALDALVGEPQVSNEKKGEVQRKAPKVKPQQQQQQQPQQKKKKKPKQREELKEEPLAESPAGHLVIVFVEHLPGTAGFISPHLSR